ncbi:hypothetical protein RB595_008285 [Gaeumannomyces hyphopodioides]
MGLGTKIKNALHGDDRRSPKGSGEYEDGRLPGSFPSDADPSTTKPTKYTQDPSLTGRTSTDGLNTSSTLHKSQHRHKKSDSGVDFSGAGEPAFDSRRQPGVGFADDAEIEQPQPVKPASLGNNTKRDPYWGTINNARGANNANGVPNTSGAGVDGYEKDLPLRPGSQGGAPRDVYAKDFVGTNNGGMLNNGNTLSNVNGAERDPYWSNGNAAGLDGSAYGVSGYGNDDTYNYNSPPGTALSGDYHSSNNNSAAVRNGHQATRGIDNPHDVNGSGLNDRSINNNTHNGAAGLDDARIRDRDMGRSPGAGGYGATAAGVSGIAASEAARKHHEADMREAGYHSGPSSGGSPTNAARLNGNSVGGARAAYGRSAGGSPPRMQQQGPVAGNPAWQQQQQGQQQQPSSATHYGPGAHNAARVLHTCTSCGVDNDISQYFRPDVAYRLGQ